MICRRRSEFEYPFTDLRSPFTVHRSLITIRFLQIPPGFFMDIAEIKKAAEPLGKDEG